MRFSFLSRQEEITLLRRSIFAVVFFLAGFGAGWWGGTTVEFRNNQTLSPLRAVSGSYRFINPLIGFDVSQPQDFPDLLLLKKRVADILNDYTAKKKLAESAVYFRVLENGHWFGIHENEEFEPGSLLKVPIMIAYFKWAEKQPDILLQKLSYSASGGENFLYAAPSGLTRHKMYTVEDLLRAMIVESDNGAKDTLLNYIDARYLNEVFRDIGVPVPHDQLGGISARVYSSFFRRLSNATFLTREFSERALTLLNETSFREGIVSGVPQGILVAHKFGERVISEENRPVGVELHDCGIIYYPEGSRLLCVMTRGYDEATLKRVIQNVAQVVSEEVKKK